MEATEKQLTKTIATPRCFTPIIKCVGFACDMRCEYCFFRDQDRTKKLMSQTVLESLVQQTLANNPYSADFVWHGGEPLLAGIDFYRKALEFQSKYRKPRQVVRNLIQTNGNLINQDWAMFFAENGFGVGLSLDGPREFHNRYRHYQDGSGNYDRVMQAIDMLKEYDLTPGVVCVITDLSVGYPEKMFRFFLDNAIPIVNFNRADSVNQCGVPLPYVPSPVEFGQFLLKTFDLWVEEDNLEVKIGPIESIIHCLVSGECSDCLFSGECDHFIIVDAEGHVYACFSDGYGESWRLGNIANLDFNSAEFQSLSNKTREIREGCQTCKWFKVCKGGCLCDYELNFPLLGEKNIVCQPLQMLYEYISQKLRNFHLI